MSKEEVQQAKDIFSSFDADHDGALSNVQARDAFLALGFDISVCRAKREREGGRKYILIERLRMSLYYPIACSSRIRSQEAWSHTFARFPQHP